MKLFLFMLSALATLAITKSLPCIGDSCGRLSPLYAEYDDDDGAVYIQEGSLNDASSDDVDKVEDSEKDKTVLSESAPVNQQQKQHANPQRLTNNDQQSLGPKPPGQGSYQSNQQPSDLSISTDENQETEYGPNPGRNSRNNNNRYNQGGNGGQNQNNGSGFNRHYPSSGNQGGNGGQNQNNGGGFNGHFPGRGNQGGNGGHNQYNGEGFNGHYPGSVNHGGNRGQFQNNGGGFNGGYPGRGNQGWGGGRFQNNDNGSNGQYPGSGNQGGNGGYYQNNGGSYGRYPSRQSSCPNCYATDFGNGHYNKNIINIEK